MVLYVNFPGVGLLTTNLQLGKKTNLQLGKKINFKLGEKKR